MGTCCDTCSSVQATESSKQRTHITTQELSKKWMILKQLSKQTLNVTTQVGVQQIPKSGVD